MSSEGAGNVENNNNDINENLSIHILEYLKNNFILNKNNVPALKNKKIKIIQGIKNDCEQKTGVEISEKNIIKKIANMKCRIKTKSDRNKTGNKKIILKKWESELLDLMSADSNPIVHKISSNLSLGILEEGSSSIIKLDESTTSTVNESAGATLASKRKNHEICDNGKHHTKKRKNAEILNAHETDETLHLNFSDNELQRHVLLKQNEVHSFKNKILEDKMIERELCLLTK